MARFKLDHLKPNGTIEHTMIGIVCHPAADAHPVVLVLQHAGEANDKYHRQLKNAQLRGAADSATIAGVFARTVVVDWKHVYDEQGNPVPFSAKDAEEFFSDLIEAGRESDVAFALAKAGDPNRFTAERVEVGKG